MASSMRDHRDHRQHNIQHQRELVRIDHHPSNQHTSREVAVVGQVPTGTRGGDNPTMIDSSLLSSSSSSLSNVYYRRSMLPNSNNNKGKNEDDKEEEGLVEEKQNRSRGYVVNVNRNNSNTVNSNSNSNNNNNNNSSSRRYHPSIDHTNWSSTSNSTYNIRKKDNNDNSGIHISNHHSRHHGEYRYNSDNSNNNDNNNSNGYDRAVHNTIPNDRYRRDNEGNRNVSSSMMNHRHSITGIGIRSASESEQQRQGAYHTNNSYRNTDTRKKNNNNSTSYSTSDNRSYNNYTNNNNDDRERHVNGTRDSYNNYQQDRGDQQRYQQRDDGQYRYSRPRYSMGGQNNATINNNNNSVDNSSNTNLNNYRRGSYIEYNNSNSNNNRGGRRGGEHHHPQIKMDQRRWSIPQHQSRSYVLPSRSSSISSKDNADRNSDNKEYKNNANSGYGRNDTTQRNSKNKTATDYYEMTSRTLGNSTREYEAVNNTICGGREEKYHRDWNERREITNALSPPPSTFSASSILMESRRRDEDKRQNNASLSLSRSRYSWSEEDHRDASGNNGNQQPSSSMIQSIPNNQNSASKLSSTDRIQGEIPFHSTRDKGMDVELEEESGKNRRAELFGTPAGIDVELSNMGSIQNDQDPLASIPETRNQQLSKQQIFSLPQSSSILSSENIDSNSKKRRHEDEPEIKLDISSKHNNNRDQYLPPEKRFRLENDKVVSNVLNSTKNDPESNILSSSPFQQSLDQRTNKSKSTIDAGKSTIQESITKKTEVLSSNSLTIAVMSTASLEKKSKTDAPYQLTNDLNNGTDKLLRQGKNKNIVAGTKLISTSSSFVVKKKVPIKPSINKMGIPMSWLKPKVKPVPKKKKIALPPPPPPPPKSTTAKKNPAARPLSPSSKDNNKGLVTDSSEGGSIVSYRNNNAVIVSGSSTNSSSQKQKRGSVPSAIVTKKNKKTKKNAQGAGCNELSDHSNKEVVQDGWNSEAEESEPEESDVDDDDNDDFQSDVEDRKVNNLSSSSSPPKSTKLKIRLSSAKLEQLSKLRLATEPLGNHDITDSNDDENIKTEASLKREKRKQEKLMALSIMINKRPDFDHEKAKKKMEEEKRKREESKPLTAKQIRQILRTDDRSNLNPNNWVRRSRRQPNKAILKSKPLRMLIGKLKMNDSEMNVLKMKKYINDPNIPSAALDSALDAMEENTNCQVLYIQNFNEGMRDQQVLHLLRILQQPSCNIWCLNIGENYNVSDKTWEKFTKGLIHTKITHMYASEHTITTDMKDEIRFTIRENRKKHDMHINPNNLNVIIQCTHCWWNPINAKVLRPYLKKQGFEHVLNDTEAQGLRGSHSAAPTK